MILQVDKADILESGEEGVSLLSHDQSGALIIGCLEFDQLGDGERGRCSCQRGSCRGVAGCCGQTKAVLKNDVSSFYSADIFPKG